MPSFFSGDELGNIKRLRCTHDKESKQWKIEDETLYAPSSHAQVASGEAEAEKVRLSGVQKLSFSSASDKNLLAAARTDGTISAFSVNTDDGKLELLNEWKDSRFKTGHTFVGLNQTPEGLYWCTSNGALGMSATSLETPKPTFSPTYMKATLPMRLCAWQLAPDGETFAYGGNEVDLSVWDAGRAFQVSESSGGVSKDSTSDAKKRKRGNDLLPDEVWRAKNLPNDSLNLRHPIHITSLTFLHSTGSSSMAAHIVTGTETGDVRRYDTRAAKRPVANWTGVGKFGGVGCVQAGLREHELFVSDRGTNLSALDLRNGRTIYSYKKLQGSITGLAPSPSSSQTGFLGSTCRDRFFRLHSTLPPPEQAGKQQEERGEVLGELYMKSVPTAIAFGPSVGDADRTSMRRNTVDDEEMEQDDDGEDVWAGLEDVEDSDEDSDKVSKKRRPGKR